MDASRSATPQVFVFVAGVDVGVPAGVDGAVVAGPDGADVGALDLEAAGLAGTPDGELAAPVPLPPGWHAVMSSVAADAVTIARAPLRIPVAYCM
ncbi:MULTISPECIES: hypothetical protein [unclassified Streptomyces]|uniref:hypothetical protein n=1 Tax=unclassified Streptomyces TaxID=2593676 RepID=UPI002E809E8A|nr:hypothetical protein [Streptomyces sp. NBC_00589]